MKNASFDEKNLYLEKLLNRNKLSIKVTKTSFSQ